MELGKRNVCLILLLGCTKSGPGPSVKPQSEPDSAVKERPATKKEICSRPREQTPWFCKDPSVSCEIDAMRALVSIARGPGMSGWKVPELHLSLDPAPPPLPRASILETNRTWVTLTRDEMTRAYAWLGTISGGMEDHRLMTVRLATDPPQDRRVSVIEVDCALQELLPLVAGNTRAHGAVLDYLKRLRDATPPMQPKKPPRGAKSVRELLPPGAHPVDIMVLNASAEAEAIALKFKTAISKNPKWFMESVKQYPGQALPWHQNMGLSRDEYATFLREQGSFKYRKAGATTLHVSSEREALVLDTRGKWPFFDALGVRVQLDGERVQCSRGVLAKRSSIAASDAQKITGPWSGKCWETLEFEEYNLSGHMIRVCVGRFSEGNRRLFLYESKSTRDTSPGSNTDFALFFDR